jgi:hypothetical protein
MNINTMDVWHQLIKGSDKKSDSELLNQLLDDDIEFFSPVTYNSQKGKVNVSKYMTLAKIVLVNDTFHYIRELVSDRDAVLEFKTTIDGLIVHGVDMITWNEDGKLVNFTVMVRPLKAINKLHQMMGAQLEKYKK